MKTMMFGLFSLALLVAACGSSDDSEDVASANTSDTSEDVEDQTTTVEATTTTVATTTTSTEPVADAAADQADASGDAASSQPAGFSLYDFRYCEILMTVTDDDGNEVTEVWGTPGVDPCTDEAWYALDPDAIQAENEASFIDMNGPRYFIVDGTAETGDGGGTGTAAGGEAVSQQFGDLTMTLLAIAEASEESTAYTPDLVVRTTTWTYQAGTEVYELTDPEGYVYTMQSYARIVDPALTAADLPTLGDQLELPEGWSYSSRVLEEPLQVELSPDGAMVVTDDLRNSYQRNG